MGIFQDFVTKIKNTFSSSDDSEIPMTMPYSFLPSIMEIKESIYLTFDVQSFDFDFLKIEIQLKKERADWIAIIQFEEKGDVFYKKISCTKDVVTKENTDLPFGYQPFSIVKNNATDALRIVQEEVSVECFDFKLYFPLSPFDTEPLWFLGLENQQQAIIGADTGSLELK